MPADQSASGAVASLRAPDVGDEVAWVAKHLGAFASDDVRAGGIPGGQSHADRALAAFDVAGYANRRNEVQPVQRRGASMLSPYIRHGLISLREAWDRIADGPSRDVESFRDELLWQEYARHVYARLGDATRRSMRFSVVEQDDAPRDSWPPGMDCIDASVRELREQGWITNQQRMWLASHWAVRERWAWRDGEDEFFRHLLDGSRAANRLGWQWTSGALTGKPYGFSRWQVEKRAPGLCAGCARKTNCPIQEWPPEEAPPARPIVDSRMRKDPEVDSTAGPSIPHADGRTIDAVWLTAESLGDRDPALAAHPGVQAIFVFDAPLLTRLRLSGKRLVFLAQSLADLASRRDIEVRLGDPVEELAGLATAATFAPVPGWGRRTQGIRPAEVHPWPWLVRPGAGPVTSFTAWRRGVGRIAHPA